MASTPRASDKEFKDTYTQFLGGNAEMYGRHLVKLCVPSGNYMRLLGFGGQKVVILYQDEALDQRRLLHLLLPDAGYAEEERFFRSAKTLIRLDMEERRQGRIPPFSTVFWASKNPPFVCMEYIEGVTLRQYMEAQDLDLYSRLELLYRLAVGLDLVNSNNIIHRDIKPDNVIVDNSGMPRWIDFGIALFTRDNPLTRTDQPMGTPLYAAPEQLMDAANVTFKADIYSFGRLFYFVLTGDEAFDLEHLPLEAVGPYSQCVQDESHIDRRYASAGDYIADLEDNFDIQIAPNTPQPQAPTSLAQAVQRMAINTNVNPGKMMRYFGTDTGQWNRLLRSVKAEILKCFV